MPYKDPEVQRNYCRQWVAKRRADYFADKACVKCGSKDRLELDHIDPAEKTHHAIWTWSEERRLAEIAKCQVLCYKCHKEKTAAYVSEQRSGKPNLWNRRLTKEDVLEIRARANFGEKFRPIGRAFGMSHGSISDIVAKRTYAEIEA
jgi:5-methylcytosine-specific restriction endonuclease McrA